MSVHSQEFSAPSTMVCEGMEVDDAGYFTVPNSDFQHLIISSFSSLKDCKDANKADACTFGIGISASSTHLYTERKGKH